MAVQSRSSTCGRSCRGTRTWSPSRWPRPAGCSSSTRTRCAAGSAPRSRRGSRTSASRISTLPSGVSPRSTRPSRTSRRSSTRSSRRWTTSPATSAPCWRTEHGRSTPVRVRGQRVDRTKPLWEMWMVEGLQDGHWALVSKVHHCMVDGVSGSDLLAVMLDPEREPPPANVDTWRPEPEPSDVRLVSEAIGDLVVSPYEQFRAMRAAARGWGQLAELFVDAARGVASMAGPVRPDGESALNGPIGPHRRWDWAHTTLADVKRVRSALGGTVNDVVLTVLTRGFRDLIVARDESPAGRVVRTLVPVSVRLADEHGVYNHRVPAMFAHLPVGITDPAERLEAIREQMAGLKESKQAVAGEVLTSLSGFAPALLLAVGTRVAFRIPQRNINTVTTNVPGPQLPLYACGRQMLEAFPFVPIAGHLRIGVAIFSYNGMLNFGVTGDYDTAPDIGVLCRGVEDGMSELLKLADDDGPDDSDTSARLSGANQN